jgi:hypothetical protein
MLDYIPAPALAADLILVFHAMVVAFVVFGQVLVIVGGLCGWQWIRNLWFRLAHLLTIGVVVAQTWLGQLCPLTLWEQDLRRAAGQAAHDQSFVGYWLGRVLFFDLPWWVFISVYTAFALLVIWSWWWLPPRRLSRPR